MLFTKAHDLLKHGHDSHASLREIIDDPGCVHRSAQRLSYCQPDRSR